MLFGFAAVAGKQTGKEAEAKATEGCTLLLRPLLCNGAAKTTLHKKAERIGVYAFTWLEAMRARELANLLNTVSSGRVTVILS